MCRGDVSAVASVNGAVDGWWQKCQKNPLRSHWPDGGLDTADGRGPGVHGRRVCPHAAKRCRAPLSINLLITCSGCALPWPRRRLCTQRAPLLDRRLDSLMYGLQRNPFPVTRQCVHQIIATARGPNSLGVPGERLRLLTFRASALFLSLVRSCSSIVYSFTTSQARLDSWVFDFISTPPGSL